MTFVDSLKVGAFLAQRTVLRGNRYVTALIVLILTLIFLNLVGVGGLLIGMVKSGDEAYYSIYSGSIVVNPLLEKKQSNGRMNYSSLPRLSPNFRHTPHDSTVRESWNLTGRNGRRGVRGTLFPHPFWELILN